MRARPIFRSIVAVIIAAVFILTYIWFQETFGIRSFLKWRPLDPPPEPVGSLLGIGVQLHPMQIYVESGPGQVYRCCQPGEPAWVAQEGAQDWHYRPCRDPSRLQGVEVPGLPEQIIACVERVTLEGPPDNVYYALGADGLVYRLRYSDPLSLFILLFCANGLLGGYIGWRISGRIFQGDPEHEDDREAAQAAVRSMDTSRTLWPNRPTGRTPFQAGSRRPNPRMEPDARD